MKKTKYFDKLILIFIVIGSIISGFIFVTNLSVIKDILLGNIKNLLILKIMSFFTISTTLISIIRINYFKNSKLWLLPIFFMSFLGTFIYGSINLINKLKISKEGDFNASNQKYK